MANIDKKVRTNQRKVATKRGTHEGVNTFVRGPRPNLARNKDK